MTAVAIHTSSITVPHKLVVGLYFAASLGVSTDM